MQHFEKEKKCNIIPVISFFYYVTDLMIICTPTQSAWLSKVLVCATLSLAFNLYIKTNLRIVSVLADSVYNIPLSWSDHQNRIVWHLYLPQIEFQMSEWRNATNNKARIICKLGNKIYKLLARCIAVLRKYWTINQCIEAKSSHSYVANQNRHENNLQHLKFNIQDKNYFFV